MNLQEIDLSKLDPNEIGAWPLQVRIIALTIIGLATILLNFLIFINPQLSTLDKQYNRQLVLRDEFREKHHKAANLEAYKNQMEEMKNTLKGLLRQLPTEGKIPSLMEDISLQATAAGLEFDLIKPGAEVSKEFYNELPIKISIVGSYHGFGRFISGIAKLPRIVTLHDFDIKTNKNTNNKRLEQDLLLEIEAKTYWCTNRESL